MDRRSLVACVGSLAVAIALAIALPARSDEDPWARASIAARFPDPDKGASAEDYADNVECRECHDDRVKSLAKSFHASLLDAKKSKSRGCQECHGPGQKHVDDGGDAPMRNPSLAADVAALWSAPAPKAGETPRERAIVPVRTMNGVCLRCHLDVLAKPIAGHRDWLARTRDPSGERSCVSCHGVHVDRSAPAYDKALGPFATPAALLASKAEFVDPKQCIACHSEFHPEMARSGHAFLLKDGPDHGCGACHGAGSLHAASGGDPRKIVLPEKQKPADADATCNACHLKGKVVERWTCAEHAREGVACIVCHDANAPQGRTLRKPEFELCGACHLDVQAQFRMPERHRVAEGRVSCSDCHDPHGNTDKVRDKDVRLRACLACHQDKGGPFLFDHGIKRTEGCVACHAPHGSTNRRMLTYAKVKPLCLQCHPDTPHDLRQRTYDNCLGCHTEIHGSDLDRRFLK
jgi:DmsE family decaheme c-type cytochrome